MYSDVIFGYLTISFWFFLSLSRSYLLQIRFADFIVGYSFFFRCVFCAVGLSEREKKTLHIIKIWFRCCCCRCFLFYADDGGSGGSGCCYFTFFGSGHTQTHLFFFEKYIYVRVCISRLFIASIMLNFYFVHSSHGSVLTIPSVYKCGISLVLLFLAIFIFSQMFFFLLFYFGCRCCWNWRVIFSNFFGLKCNIMILYVVGFFVVLSLDQFENVVVAYA